MATNNDWNNQIAAANSVITLNSGTNNVNISTDASATTINIATGGAVKTTQFGSTNTTSSTIIQSGSGNIVYNSGLTIDSSGRNKNTVQPCFLASHVNDQSNVTGDGTSYTVQFTNVIFDQNSNYNGSTTFTAPVAGKYLFCTSIYVSNLLSTGSTRLAIVASGTTYPTMGGNLAAIALASGAIVCLTGKVIVSMAASDTATVTFRVNGSSKNVTLPGSTTAGVRVPCFSGFLIC